MRWQGTSDRQFFWIFPEGTMRDNHLKKSFHWLAWVMAILFLLSFIDEFSVGRFKFKNVNILADIYPDPPRAVVKNDSVKQNKKKPATRKNPCPPGITCVEDYSENKNALGNFFKALPGVRRRPVRVAFFGDSFIEGDILCASFRDTLQQLFGGHGVGYVPITSEVTQFRTTIRHSFNGWKTYWAVGEKSPFAPLGLSGYCFIPQEENEVEYRPGKKESGAFRNARLFYTSPLPAQLHYTLDDSLFFEQSLEPSETLQQTVVPCEGAQAIKLHFEPFDSLRLYGVSFESNTGLIVDNFAMRGNSGMGLLQTATKELREFNHFRNYKLILLQYGLNVVGESDTIGYDWYADKMVRVISRLKENFPESSILLLGISDRSYNQNGKFVTMPNILLMRRAQREIARKSKIAFWDVYTAMGGENSMVKFVAANPPLAAKDYTHLTYRGGRKLAKKLAEALLYDRAKHDKTKKTP
jgi:hypothetical protein